MVALPEWITTRILKHVSRTSIFERMFHPPDDEDERTAKYRKFQRYCVEQGYFWGYMDAIRDTKTGIVGSD